jgi:hypothetical protein
VHRYSPLLGSFDVDRGSVRSIFIDETMVNLGGTPAWIWVAFERGSGSRSSRASRSPDPHGRLSPHVGQGLEHHVRVVCAVAVELSYPLPLLVQPPDLGRGHLWL